MKDVNLCFCGVLDFYPNRVYYKEKYKRLTLDNKCIYKMYVYSLPFDDDKTKDLIWEYLNDWEESESELEGKYLKKKEIVDKRKKNECKDTI